MDFSLNLNPESEPSPNVKRVFKRLRQEQNCRAELEIPQRSVVCSAQYDATGQLIVAGNPLQGELASNAGVPGGVIEGVCHGTLFVADSPSRVRRRQPVRRVKQQQENIATLYRRDNATNADIILFIGKTRYNLGTYKRGVQVKITAIANESESTPFIAQDVIPPVPLITTGMTSSTGADTLNQDYLYAFLPPGDYAINTTASSSASGGSGGGGNFRVNFNYYKRFRSVSTIPITGNIFEDTVTATSDISLLLRANSPEIDTRVYSLSYRNTAVLGFDGIGTVTATFNILNLDVDFRPRGYVSLKGKTAYVYLPYFDTNDDLKLDYFVITGGSVIKTTYSFRENLPVSNEDFRYPLFNGFGTFNSTEIANEAEDPITNQESFNSTKRYTFDSDIFDKSNTNDSKFNQTVQFIYDGNFAQEMVTIYKPAEPVALLSSAYYTDELQG